MIESERPAGSICPKRTVQHVDRAKAGHKAVNSQIVQVVSLKLPLTWNDAIWYSGASS
jgi:hypothetical protein